MQIDDSDARQGLRLVRWVLAILLFIHGAARVATDGVAPFGAFLDGRGFPFGLGIAWAITVFELAGAPLFALGRGIAPIALAFSAVYACGIWLVHAPAGWFVVGLGRNGAEYSVLILACLLAHAWAYRPQAFRKPRGPR